MAMQGFLLGLANGATCLAYCAPVLIPLMLGEGQKTRQNWALLGKFLGGRMAGYLLFGLLAWLTSQIILRASAYRNLILGAAYVVLAAFLAAYGFSKTPPACAASLKGARKFLRQWPALLPLGLGFLTGLNLCPPFLLAFTSAAGAGSLAASLVFFLAFFGGTSLYFLPMALVGLMSHVNALRTVGKLAAVLMAFYYAYSGIIYIAGGLVQL
jgi:sulfite exporter TauE/SafE